MILLAVSLSGVRAEQAVTRPAVPVAPGVPVAGPYLGWDAFTLENGLVTLRIVPAIGGRVMQYSLGNEGFLWVNPALAGKAPTPDGVGPGKSWLNYGGDKLWLAPQGWDNEHQWPGPPDGVLDGSPHDAEILPDGIRLSSSPDPLHGVRLVRTISLDPGSTRVRFAVEMRNAGDKPCRWGIWEHAQLDAALPGGGPNGKLKSYCVLDPRGHFERGYAVLFGAQDNPSWVADKASGLFRADYRYKVGKAVVDSPGGWVATVDGRRGIVFVQFFRHERGRDYPDGASVEFWHNGAGTFRAWGKENTAPDDPSKNPCVAESELISPFFALAPGESCRWDYQWCAANLGGDYPVVDCTPVAAVSEPLKVRRTGEDHARITGRWGVFEKGILQAVWIGSDGNQLGRIELGEASPLKAVLLDSKVPLPRGAVSLKLGLVDAKGAPLGELGRTFVPASRAGG
jgi:hypothetical protein